MFWLIPLAITVYERGSGGARAWAQQNLIFEWPVDEDESEELFWIQCIFLAGAAIIAGKSLHGM